MNRIYLAGPEVFHPQAKQLGVEKKDICARYGFVGVYPIDADLDLANLTKREAGLLIGAANQDLIRSCQIVVANITPFRGPSADAGTVWEMGFAAGIGLKVSAYSNDPTPFAARTQSFVRSRDDATASDERDADGMLIEDFDLADNLMLESSISSTGGILVVAEAKSEAPFTDLAAFERCIRMLNGR
jgi:nucleoside 2-deoxyribosyltransferase